MCVQHPYLRLKSNWPPWQERDLWYCIMMKVTVFKRSCYEVVTWKRKCDNIQDPESAAEKKVFVSKLRHIWEEVVYCNIWSVNADYNGHYNVACVTSSLKGRNLWTIEWKIMKLMLSFISLVIYFLHIKIAGYAQAK